VYIYATPNEEVESYIEGAPSGLTGTVGYQVINLETDVAIAARTTAGVVEIPAGSGAYYVKVLAPNKPGSYAVVWDTGEISPETSATDVLVVNSTGVVPPTVSGTGNLISLEQLRIAHGIPASTIDPELDAKYEQAIRGASAAIRSYTDRSFGVPTKTSTKLFEYDSSGFIDIDDAMEVKTVAFRFGALTLPLDEFYWRPEPQDGPPYEYMTIPHWAGIYSPQMGFRYNLDVISRERGWPGLIPLIAIEAVWGWPEIPADVEEAAILTAAAFAQKPDAFVGESIENYSYTMGTRSSLKSEAIPDRARDLLNTFVRFQI
jgi:hypothetical protein